MFEFDFEWSDAKAATNSRKHGVTFEEAASAFYDGNACPLRDSEHSSGEERNRLIGISNKHRVLMVVHTVRGAKTIRIITARRATAGELKAYGKED